MANPYYGLAETELLALRTAAVAQMTAILAGTIFESVSVGGKTFTRRLPDASSIQNQIALVNSELRRIDPDTYGVRVTKTTANFNNFDPH